MLAEPVLADRDYPPLIAPRATALPCAPPTRAPGATLRCIGEIQRRQRFRRRRGRRRMRADHDRRGRAGRRGRRGDDRARALSRRPRDVRARRRARPEHRAARQRSARGAAVAGAGHAPGLRGDGAWRRRWGSTASTCSRGRASAILSTGDEVVDIAATPGPLQIRNSNGISLETLAALAGAESRSARQRAGRKRRAAPAHRTRPGSGYAGAFGGVSMGKYDLVEPVLARAGRGVLLRRGGDSARAAGGFRHCRGKLVFGLPGNPVSTMVTFELFVLPAIDILERRGSRGRCRSFARGWRTPVHETRRADAFSAGARARRSQRRSRRFRCCRGRARGTWWRWRRRMRFLIVPPEKAGLGGRGDGRMVLLRRGRRGC